MRYWLMKSEPSEVSIDDLAAMPNQSVAWFGVRNYQARNFMRDDMQVGDGVLFYHSRSDKAIVGVARVSKVGYPDPHQFDPKSNYYDPKAKPEEPRWIMVEIEYLAKLATPLELGALKAMPELEGMLLLARGQRLSVQPVTKEHFSFLMKLAKIPLKQLKA